MNKTIYGQFLLSSQINYTCTYLADHFDALTHDNVQYFLSHARIRPRDLWQSVRHQLKAGSEGYIIFDDTVLSKIHSRKIELVRSQWSGNAHGIIQGIGVVNCVYFNPVTSQYWLPDYRIFAPQSDGKTKIDHVMDMLVVLKSRGVAYGCVLMDTWYAVTGIMKYVISEGKIFYCPLKKNRKVDDGSRDANNEKQKYRQIQDLEWSAGELTGGKTVKVHKMPMDTKFKLFRVVLTTERTDYIATNDIAQSSAQAAEEKSTRPLDCGAVSSRRKTNHGYRKLSVSKGAVAAKPYRHGGARMDSTQVLCLSDGQDRLQSEVRPA